jgi:hypothetical protein
MHQGTAVTGPGTDFQYPQLPEALGFPLLFLAKENSAWLGVGAQLSPARSKRYMRQSGPDDIRTSIDRLRPPPKLGWIV